MRELVIISLAIVFRLKRKLLTGAVVLLLLLGGFMAGRQTGWEGTSVLLHCLVFFPFLFSWYLCSAFERRFFHVNILTRNIHRQTFFFAGMLGMAAVFAVFVQPGLLAALMARDVSWPEALGGLGVLQSLALVDFVLFLAIAYSLCLHGYPGLSFLFVAAPALTVFKSPQFLSFAQLNYAFPLIGHADMRAGEVFTHAGGFLRVFENLAAAAAIIFVAQYFYMRKDLTE